jgi:hypothetical protein
MDTHFSRSIAILLVVFGIFACGSVTAQSTSPTASTTLVLSQVYGGGGGSTGTYLNDYIEIKNISSSPQSLNGLSLYYGSATGNFASTASNAFALPNVTLNPGQYFLVQTSAAGSAGAPLPVTPDATTGNLSMSGTNGKVGLVTASQLPINTCGSAATPCNSTQLAAFVDWVAYGQAGNGTAGNGEGGTSVNNNTALTSTQGAVRKNSGCTDTDNNNADFDVVSGPIPRNTASNAVSCGGPPAHVQHIVDFNGDGKTDWSVTRDVNDVMVWLTNFTGTNSYDYQYWGKNSRGDLQEPNDYDGDGKTDVAVYAPNDGNYYIQRSSIGLGDLLILPVGVGADGDFSGDYTGDAKADAAAVDKSGNDMIWTYTPSAGPNAGVPKQVAWGYGATNPNAQALGPDFAAPGDYNGDGKADFCAQRPLGDAEHHAAFYVHFNDGVNNPPVQDVNIGVIFGWDTDTIVPGDYDGDGKTDIAVARNVGGNWQWFYLKSSTNLTTVGYLGTWGLAGVDVFAQGDYDGDGKTDIAVWRPSDQTFYVVSSQTGSGIYMKWGTTNDQATANYNNH